MYGSFRIYLYFINQPIGPNIRYNGRRHEPYLLSEVDVLRAELSADPPFHMLLLARKSASERYKGARPRDQL